MTVTRSAQKLRDIKQTQQPPLHRLTSVEAGTGARQPVRLWLTASSSARGRRYGNRRRGSRGRWGATGGSWTSTSARRRLAPARSWRRPGRRKCSPSRCLAGHAARVAARRAARRRGWQRQRGSCGGGPRQLVFDRRVFDRRVPRSCPPAVDDLLGHAESAPAAMPQQQQQHRAAFRLVACPRQHRSWMWAPLCLLPAPPPPPTSPPPWSAWVACSRLRALRRCCPQTRSGTTGGETGGAAAGGGGGGGGASLPGGGAGEPRLWEPATSRRSSVSADRPNPQAQGSAWTAQGALPHTPISALHHAQLPSTRASTPGPPPQHLLLSSSSSPSHAPPTPSPPCDHPPCILPPSLHPCSRRGQARGAAGAAARIHRQGAGGRAGAALRQRGDGRGGAQASRRGQAEARAGGKAGGQDGHGCAAPPTGSSPHAQLSPCAAFMHSSPHAQLPWLHAQHVLRTRVQALAHSTPTSSHPRVHPAAVSDRPGSRPSSYLPYPHPTLPSLPSLPSPCPQSSRTHSNNWTRRRSRRRPTGRPQRTRPRSRRSSGTSSKR